jgi:hypothetical protein
MYCSKCGTENSENSKYCQECGISLIKNEDVESSNNYYTVLGIGLISFIISLFLVSGYNMWIFVVIGLMCGIYLVTRPEDPVKKRGILMLVGGAILLLINAGILYSAMFL